MEKCVWCNRSDGYLEEVTVEAPDRFGFNPGGKMMTAHPEHTSPVHNYYSLAARVAKRYVLVMVIVGGLALLGLIPLLMIDQQGGGT